MSRNPNAISILEKNLDKLDWYYLSRNPNAISILEKNQDKIRWDGLSENPNAISILEQNQDKIDWFIFPYNRAISKLNYQWLQERMDIIREDLMKAVFHPKRLEYYLEHHDYDIFDY